MITEDTVLAFGPTASLQSVGDGAVILLADSGQLYTGNGTTEVILRHVDGRRSVAALAAALCEEFDASPEAVIGDVVEIAGQLIDEGVLRIVE